MTTAADGPLEGITVLAIEQAVAMPFCSFMLAELGARVIKVEHPARGDVIRGWDDVVAGLSSGYVWLSANKENLALDLKHPAARPVLDRLIASADVVLENHAPGVAERLGIDAATLRERHPSLIHCSLSGYGQTGPYRDIKAYDLLIQGESGILLTNGTDEQPAKIGLPITDLIAGSTAAMAVLAALVARQRHGEGATLDIAMLDAALPWLGYFPHRFWHDGTEPPRTGMRHQYIIPYGPYLASDGVYVNLVVANSSDWERFCRDVIARPDLVDDPRSATMTARFSHRAEVEREVEQAFATEPSEAWIERLAATGLPYGRVRSMADVVSHEQVTHRRMIVEATSPVGPIPLMRSPLGPAERLRHVAWLGEHTDTVLTGLDIPQGEIDGLREAGAIA